jgi:hypothetical protein
MARDIVYFDLETRRTQADVGGWDRKGEMGISVAVTYSTRTGKYIIYTEDESEELAAQLVRADLVVGYNHVGFDYEVLRGYTIMDFRDLVRSLDLMLDLASQVGHRPKLEAVASATLGTGKSADGLQAIRWWQEGKLLEIAEYCCYDVKVTRLVHEYGARHGHVKYVDREGRPHEIPVPWKLEDA